MSRVVFVAIGSRGDVLPMVSLACELMDRGVEVLVLAHPEYMDIPKGYGVPAISLEAGLVEHASARRRAQGLIGNVVLANIGLQVWQLKIAGKLAPVLTQQIRAGDVVICGIVGVAAALALAADRGCRPVHVTFSATLPTSGPMAMMSPRTTRPNRLVGWWTRHGVWTGSLTLGGPLDWAVRRRLKPPWRSSQAVARRALVLPIMVAASRVLVHPQPDWPRNTAVTGAWVSDREFPVPPRGLTQWLEQHPQSVYVGFGSMLSRDPARDLRLVDKAARAAGVSVIYRADDSASELESTSMVHVVRNVDHQWLFPQCAAVVHHGGAGTTNAALAAGVPSAIISHGFDQPFHGRRLHELGVGPAPLKRASLTSPMLAALLQDLTRGATGGGHLRRAAEVGLQVRNETGVATAADWLGQWCDLDGANEAKPILVHDELNQDAKSDNDPLIC